jgi:hypothetical protein
MRMSDVGLMDECFTHIGNDGHQTSWASSALYRFCVANPDKVALGPVVVDEEHAAHCVEQRGVEQERLDVLTANPEYLKKPILFVHLPDDTHLLVDGTHRYVVYFALSMEMILAYMVEWEHAKAFIIEDMPQTSVETIMGPSMLTPLRKAGFIAKD